MKQIHALELKVGDIFIFDEGSLVTYKVSSDRGNGFSITNTRTGSYDYISNNSTLYLWLLDRPIDLTHKIKKHNIMQVPNKIISIDVESDGLYGRPFAIAAVVYEYETEYFVPGSIGSDGIRHRTGEKRHWKEIERFSKRLPDGAVKNEWVKENVLPAISGVRVTHNHYEDMLSDFATFYHGHKDGTVLWHMGHVVEAFLFRECVRLGFIGEFEGPYTPIEVSMTLREHGYDPSSIDAVMTSSDIEKPLGSSHDPLYDCIVAFQVWNRLNGF